MSARLDSVYSCLLYTSALFRADDRREPFLRVVTREDGVYVARFPAKPGEVIYGRGYIVDSRTGKEIYGDEWRLSLIHI